MSLLQPKLPSMDKHRWFYEKRKVILLLGKYMDEYNLDSTRIFNADNSSISIVQKYQKTLHRTGKLAGLHNEN